MDGDGREKMSSLQVLLSPPFAAHLQDHFCTLFLTSSSRLFAPVHLVLFSSNYSPPATFSGLQNFYFSDREREREEEERRRKSLETIFSSSHQRGDSISDMKDNLVILTLTDTKNCSRTLRFFGSLKELISSQEPVRAGSWNQENFPSRKCVWYHSILWLRTNDSINLICSSQVRKSKLVYWRYLIPITDSFDDNRMKEKVS